MPIRASFPLSATDPHTTSLPPPPARAPDESSPHTAPNARSGRRLADAQAYTLARSSSYSRHQPAHVDIYFLAGKFLRAAVPRKQDQHRCSQRAARRRNSVPWPLMRRRHRRHLEDSLRSDDDVREVKFHVRKRAEKARVKLAR